MKEVSYQINDLQIDYVSVGNGGFELQICPTSKVEARVKPRGDAGPNYAVGSKSDRMVQVKLASDRMDGGFLPGVTMQDSMTALGLKHVATEACDIVGLADDVITTTFVNESGLRCCQHLQATSVPGTLISWVSVTNGSAKDESIEYLASFVLSGISPFASDDAPGRLRLHRFRSWWSNEGRHENVLLEDIHLVRNWHGNNVTTERFGQLGTMPVRKFFPFVALEDTEAGVLWGAQLAWAGSWQMEVARRGDAVSLSGGLADYEFGHWKKTLPAGERFESPKAHLACVAGSFADLTSKLVQLQESLLPEPVESEKDLPVIFNEWCTNWGSPSHDKTLALAERLKGSGVKYIVIDDGWAKRPAEATMQSNGDWILDTDKFPHGIKATCDTLREMGFIPGIWFEFEVCNPAAEAFQQTAHQLQRDGQALHIGERRFWDLNDPWVVDYFDQKLIGFLEENGFGYLKVDYNDSIGIGCDHPDSLGEGLRRQVEGIYSSFKRIKAKLGDFVIENCSSGGHRLEPSMMALTSMSSFSDAHESVNIPIIARQLQHMMPPRQSQIWAVLYPTDSPERFMYSLTATFYGRMCLSGPVHDLNDAQIAIVHRAVSFYQSVAAIIRDGVTHYLGETPLDWMEPEGWSGICRMNRAGDEALVVIHEYRHSKTMTRELTLPLVGQWDLVDALVDGVTESPQWADGVLSLPQGAEFRGYALFLKCRSDSSC